jgi:hypothetical protein
MVWDSMRYDSERPTNIVSAHESSLSSPLQRYLVNKAQPSWTKRMNMNIYVASLAANKQCRIAGS